MTQPKNKNAIRFEGRFENREPVLDADFETVDARLQAEPPKNAEPVAPHAEKAGAAIKAADKIGMSVFGKKPARPRGDDSIAFYGFGACLVALSFWVSGGYSLFSNVDMMPTAALSVAKSTSVAKGTSEITDASWRVVTVDGQSALHVEGIVRNSGKNTVHTKPVTVAVTHNDGSTKRYLLGQDGWTLGAGQEVVVSGRLDIGAGTIASVVIALSK